LLQPRDERAQVAVVDPHKPGTDVEHALQLVAVVDFHERLQSYLTCRAIQSHQFRSREGLRDQQCRIGTRQPGFQQLITIQDKVFPQQWHGDRRADLRQIGQTPLKVGLIREHADTGGSVPLVGTGDGHRIEVSPDHTGRRRRLLDLGDDLNVAGSSQSRTKIANRCRVDEPTLQVALGRALPCRCHFPALAGNDLVKDIAHDRPSASRDPEGSAGISWEPRAPLPGSRPRGCTFWMDGLSIAYMVCSPPSAARRCRFERLAAPDV